MLWWRTSKTPGPVMPSSCESQNHHNMEKPMQDVVKATLENVSKHTSKLEDFLGVQKSSAKAFQSCTKSLYDTTKAHLPCDTPAQSLPELITAGFDDEQIWQELELHNAPSVQSLMASVARLTVAKQCTFGLTATGGSADEGLGEDLVAEDEEDLEEMEEEEEEEAEDYGDEDEDAVEDEDEDDNLLLNSLGDDDGDESEEEKELKALLDKVTAERTSDQSDDDSDINFDFDTEQDNKSKVKNNMDKDTTSVKKRKTVVDDKFFKLADMEEFLEAEDARWEKQRRREEGEEEESESDEDDNENLEGTDSEDENARQMTYADFFDPPEDDSQPSSTQKKKVHFAMTETEENDDENDDGESDDESGNVRTKKNLLESSDSEGEDVEDILGGKKKKQKSTFEERQERLKAKISDMEESAISEKPWQLMGEVTGGSRPENSLLEEALDFEHTARLPPQITEETTKSLEDIIRQRIKDKSWDDVERKERATEEAFEYKKRIVLDQDKSKLSLSQVYEQEYLKLQQKEEEEKADPDHDDIKKMMTSLFVKLDALSNFHYTPKPAAPEVQIVSNQPSIAMEEVAPVSVSDAAMLAPQEVEDKQKRELVGKTERSETDKKRDLRDKKAGQRKRARAKERKQKAIEKLRPGLGNKYAKEKAMKDLEKQSKAPRGNVSIIKGKGKSDLTTSSKFFTQLQEEVTAHVQSKKSQKKHKSKEKQGSASKFKL